MPGVEKKSMSALDALTRRVSGQKMMAPAPDELEVHTMLSAAVRAPDHGRLKPWRFTILKEDRLTQFGELTADDFLQRNRDATPAQLERERAKPMRAPLIIVVAAKVDCESLIPAIEQVLATAAAAQNIMLAAFAMGYGCAWKTGDAAYSARVKAAFNLTPSDAIVGFLYVGTPDSELPVPAPADPEEHVTQFNRVTQLNVR